MDEPKEYNEEDIIDITIPTEKSEAIDTTSLCEAASGIILSPSVTEAITNMEETVNKVVKRIDLSGVINAMKELLCPIIDSIIDEMCTTAMAIIDMVQRTIRSFGLWLYSGAQKIIKKLWCEYDKEIALCAYVNVLLNSAPFIKSLLSFFENNSSTIRDVFLKGTHNRSSSDDTLDFYYNFELNTHLTNHNGGKNDGPFHLKRYNFKFL